MPITGPKQVGNLQISALHADSTVRAMVVHSVDASGAYVSPGAGSTQVSIQEILTSSGASVMDSTNNAIGVTIRAGSAAGTEYTDGDVDATPNGGAVFFMNGTNTMRVVSATNPLPVSGTFSASTQVAVSSVAGIVTVAGVVRSTNGVAADFLATVTPTAGSTWNVRPLQSSAADLRATVYQSTAADLNVTVVGLVRSTNSVAADFLATVTPTAGSTWNVRPLQSSAADLQATVTPASGSTWSVRPLQSSQADLRATIYQSTAADLNVTVVGLVRSTNSVAADLLATVTPTAGSTWNVRPLQSSAADLQATVTPVSGSTWNVRPLQSSAADLQMTATPASGSTWNVRPLQSSAADLQMTATPASGSTWNVRPLQSSQADLRATVYQSSAAEFKAQSWTFDSTGGGVIGSTASPGVGVNALSVRQVYPTLLSTTVQITSTHSTAIYVLVSSAASPLRHKVYAYFVGSTHTNPSTLIFCSSGSATGLDHWHVNFGSGSSGMTGANMAMSPPGFIFAGVANNALNVKIEGGGSSVTSTVIARISIAYFTEA